MKIGTVTEKLRVRKGTDGISEGTLLRVELEDGQIAALDRTGAVPGDRVLVVLGHTAGRYSMTSPVDAVITAVVEKEE